MFEWWQRWRNAERPIYVVGGFMRSGTTMMMQALEAGGLRVDRAPLTDPASADYELSAEQLRAGWEYTGGIEQGDLLPSGRFPLAHKGRLIKVPAGAARYCDPNPGGYLVAYMRRDPQAIMASQKARWNNWNDAASIEAQTIIDRNVWLGRQDCPVTLVELDYDAVLASPEAAFRKLKAAGFPINVRKALRVIDSGRLHPAPLVNVGAQ